jgi:excisionase family DNA binding protein
MTAQEPAQPFSPPPAIDDTGGAVSPTVGELATARYLFDVAASVLRRDLPGHPALHAVPTLAAWITAQISLRRNRDDPDLEESTPGDGNDLITTAEAANILQLTQRRVQQKIAAGELRAEKIGRESFLRREDIA